MFTGIIDHCGMLLKIEPIASGLRLWIKTRFQDLQLGESISVNGICLTVTQIEENMFCCDLSPETLDLTTAKHFQLQQRLNLERALQLSSRLGGHFVTGHVDQTANVKSIQRQDDFVKMIFDGVKKPEYVIQKGSIAVNGVSLTINFAEKNEFHVMLIPHTLEHTDLGELQENNTVNLEFDMIARIVTEQTKRVVSV